MVAEALARTVLDKRVPYLIALLLKAILTFLYLMWSTRVFL